MLAIMLMAAACGSPAGTNNQDLEQFFKLGIRDQEKQFRSLNIEDQFKIFIYGNQHIHPPALYLVQSFATSDSQLVPFLRKKLEDAHDDLTIRDIAAIMAEVARRKAYDFAADEALIRLLEQRVGAMRGPWKTIASDDVRSIVSR